MYRILSIPLFCLVTLCINCPFVLSAQTCGGEGVAVQVLGSGGPELQDKRASSSYLVWQDGQARVLVDAGGGSALRFGESGAKMSQLDVILFTHFHVDHSADFPALIFSSWFEERARPLPVYGPAGNSEFPSTVDFVRAFFNNRNGFYRYLSLLLVLKRRAATSCSLITWSGTHPRWHFAANIFRRMPLGSSMGLYRP